MSKQPPVILAIDDSQLTLTQLEFLISNQTPCQFVGFSCGHKALASTEIHHASLILLDINMPSIDGVEMLRKLGELNITRPIALLSGEDSLLLKNAASLAELHGLNIISYIKKPLSVAKLAELYTALCDSLTETPLPQQQVSYSQDEIIAALNNNQYIAFYQPKVCCKTEKIIGVEALARWEHPTDGIILPCSFIEILESTQHSPPLSQKILEQVVNFWSENTKLLESLQFSINISANELCDINLPEKFEQMCNVAGMPTSQITLELTERNVINNIKHSLDVLLRFKLKGFKLSIDDFGIGYSSMKLLSELPFNELKIDRCFTNGCSSDANKKAIVTSTCEIAHKLSLEIVAEGAEEISDVQLLKSLGIKSIQGFYYYKPCSQKNLIQLLLENSTTTSVL